MIRIVSIIFICLMTMHYVDAQIAQGRKPKLVVGIVVDQMRFDYLHKFDSGFGDEGFRRIIRDGFNFANTRYTYVIPETAPGHSSIFTGTTPATHGIIGNSWYDRESKTYVSNVGDPSETIVGSKHTDEVGLSPRNLLSTTIGDQIRLGSNFRSKVISVSLKDRGSILSGGNSATAYWLDLVHSPGYFVSSTFYMDKLPKWVEKFNKLEKVDSYLNETWNTLYPIDRYIAGAPDNNEYEPSLGGKSAPVFPYDFKEMRAKYPDNGSEYQLLLVSPRGNDLLTEFALEAIEKEQLGDDNDTDLLTISFSVPDVVGHTFGPQSVEIQDIYFRLDKNIEEILNKLDSDLGRDNYILFLTSDHAAMMNAHFLKDNKLPAGIAPINTFTFGLSDFLDKKYGRQPWIEEFQFGQVYLNRKLIFEQNLDLAEMQRETADFLLTQKEIVGAVTASNLMHLKYENDYRAKLQRGFHPNRSGDVILQFLPGFVQQNQAGMTVERIKGTTHESGYAYDTHVPLLWTGMNIPRGESVREVDITDIAPSLAMMLNLQLPNGTSGKPLKELFD